MDFKCAGSVRCGLAWLAIAFDSQRLSELRKWIRFSLFLLVLYVDVTVRRWRAVGLVLSFVCILLAYAGTSTSRCLHVQAAPILWDEMLRYWAQWLYGFLVWPMAIPADDTFHSFVGSHLPHNVVPNKLVYYWDIVVVGPFPVGGDLGRRVVFVINCILCVRFIEGNSRSAHFDGILESILIQENGISHSDYSFERIKGFQHQRF